VRGQLQYVRRRRTGPADDPDLREGVLARPSHSHGLEDRHLRVQGDEQRHDRPRLEVEGNGVEAKIGDIQPGTAGTLRVTLTKNGSYELYCPIDGHRGQGMQGTVSVGSGSGAGGTTTNDAGTTTSRGYGY
jgi:hypothetical protein